MIPEPENVVLCMRELGNTCFFQNQSLAFFKFDLTSCWQLWGFKLNGVDGGYMRDPLPDTSIILTRAHFIFVIFRHVSYIFYLT